MKKKVGIALAVAALILLLFPIRMELKDGGSVSYQAILYRVTKVHALILEDEAEASGKAKPYHDGIRIEILGMKLFDNVK